LTLLPRTPHTRYPFPSLYVKQVWQYPETNIEGRDFPLEFSLTFGLSFPSLSDVVKWTFDRRFPPTLTVSLHEVRSCVGFKFYFRSPPCTEKFPPILLRQSLPFIFPSTACSQVTLAIVRLSDSPLLDTFPASIGEWFFYPSLLIISCPVSQLPSNSLAQLPAKT